jgi:hypothetical protein
LLAFVLLGNVCFNISWHCVHDVLFSGTYLATESKHHNITWQVVSVHYY